MKTFGLLCNGTVELTDDELNYYNSMDEIRSGLFCIEHCPKSYDKMANCNYRKTIQNYDNYKYKISFNEK